ncbi:MAG TPA: hypothetical protein VFT50_12945 [Baekduia sp.]|nr:hypothetical protein [Baekduia sp.]
MSSERGEFTLVGLLVAIVIFLVVLMATFTAFDVFNRNARDSQVRNEATDRARNASDTMARQMRNLATPTALQPNAVARAQPYDLIFETVAPGGAPPAGNPQNIEFVRYCLDAATLTFWTMELPPASITASTTPPTGTGCPGAGWSNVRAVAQSIVNVHGSASRPVFTFDSTISDNIRRIRADLYVDPDPTSGPAEQQVTTGVELRNQDRAPTASFTVTTPGGGVAVLDGSTSTDPDNDPLTYCWYDTAATGTVGDCGAHSISDATYFRYRVDPAGTQHSIYLTVTDPSGLPSTSPTRTITIP